MSHVSDIEVERTAPKKLYFEKIYPIKNPAVWPGFQNLNKSLMKLQHFFCYKFIANNYFIIIISCR